LLVPDEEVNNEARDEYCAREHHGRAETSPFPVLAAQGFVEARPIITTDETARERDAATEGRQARQAHNAAPAATEPPAA